MNGQGTNFWGDLGQRMASPEMGVMYGNVAQGMAPQGTWQSAVGGAGAGAIKSQIASKAATEEAEKQRLYDEAFMKLAGMDHTDQKMGRGTKTTFGPGNKVVHEGMLGEGMGSFGMNQGVANPQEMRPIGSTPEYVPGGSPGPSGNVGEMLANFPASSASGGVNLAGLTPQEINAIMGQRATTEQLNLAKAKSLYEMNAPKKGQVVAGKDFHWRINPYTGEAEKTAIPAYHAPTYPPGYAASVTPKTVKWWDKEGKSHTTSVMPNQYNSFATSVEAAGGQLGEQPGQITEETKFKEDRAKRHSAALMTVGKGDESDEARMAVPELNRTSPDSSTTAWFWKEPSFFKPEYDLPFIGKRKEGAQKVELPKYKGKQLNMGNVRSLMDKFGISAKDVIDKINEVNK